VLTWCSLAVRQLKADDPYKVEARNFLLKHNPPELYTYDQVKAAHGTVWPCVSHSLEQPQATASLANDSTFYK
jgi:hypothetical protein